MWPLAVWVQDRWRVASLDFSACSCPLEREREREREGERGREREGGRERGRGRGSSAGQKKVSMLVKCPHARVALLFREVYSFQECLHRGSTVYVLYILYVCRVDVIIMNLLSLSRLVEPALVNLDHTFTLPHTKLTQDTGVGGGGCGLGGV